MILHARSGRFHPLLVALLVPVAFSSGPAGAQETVEERNSAGVYRIKAPALHSLGITGRGVTIAVIDTGILAQPGEFWGRVLPGYNAFDGTGIVADGDGHGTHVSGILGARKSTRGDSGMFGVAYDARILPIKVLDDDGIGPSTVVARGIQHAVNERNMHCLPRALKPFVVNLSLGSFLSSPTIEQALRNAVDAGMLVAAAAGNSGDASPVYPARYANEAWANGQIIAVGAVDADNVIASWSNRAGETRDYYLVAPGVSVYSTYSVYDADEDRYQPAYATLSGTSMATPYVTGAAALIKSGWPYLNANAVSSILFDSATDLGAPGVDEVYGNGLLNLERALQPIGPLSAPTADGSGVGLAGTSLTGSAAAGSALVAAGRAGLLRVAALDSYNRDFEVDLAATVRRLRAPGNALASMLEAIDAESIRRHDGDGSVTRLALRSGAAQLALGKSPTSEASGGYALSSLDASGRELVFGVSGMGTRSFGLSGELARLDEFSGIPAVENPYFALAPQHAHAGVGLPLTGGLRLKLGILISDPSVPGGDSVLLGSGQRQRMFLAEIAGAEDAPMWSLGVGQLRESDSVLGTTQTGALELSGSANTSVAGFGFSFSPAARLTLGLQYTVGYTGAIVNQAVSLVSGYTQGRSEAYGLFASLREPLGTNDSLSLSLSRPMRMVSGAMNLVVASGVDESGSPILTSRSISLRPDGRETRADLLYSSPVNKHTKWFLGVAVRDQPDHDPVAPTEVTLGAGIRAAF